MKRRTFRALYRFRAQAYLRARGAAALWPAAWVALDGLELGAVDAAKATVAASSSIATADTAKTFALREPISTFPSVCCGRAQMEPNAPPSPRTRRQLAS